MDKMVPKEWKLEGAAFERVKKLKDEYEFAGKAYQLAQRALWDQIYKEIPDIELSASHLLHPETEDEGFFMVTESIEENTPQGE